jgi:hypothetical protein
MTVNAQIQHAPAVLFFFFEMPVGGGGAAALQRPARVMPFPRAMQF